MASFRVEQKAGEFSTTAVFGVTTLIPAVPPRFRYAITSIVVNNRDNALKSFWITHTADSVVMVLSLGVVSITGPSAKRWRDHALIMMPGDVLAATNFSTYTLAPRYSIEVAIEQIEEVATE